MPQLQLEFGTCLLLDFERLSFLGIEAGKFYVLSQNYTSPKTTLIVNIIYHILWVLQHPDLTVTSEEKVLNAILMWGMKAKDLYGWEVVDELIINSVPEHLFGERLQSVHDLLPFVRFPLLPYPLLKKVCRPLI